MGINLFGFVKHNAIWDLCYFGEVFDRSFLVVFLCWDDALVIGMDYWVIEYESCVDIIGFYYQVWVHSDAMIDVFDFDMEGYVLWWYERVLLFNVMVYCLFDIIWYVGYVDILCEGFDGQVGIGVGGLCWYGYDRVFWEVCCMMIERLVCAADLLWFG